MWRERLTARVTPGLLDQMAQAERHGFGTLIPADKEWPAGLNNLGERAPYLLWTRGAASFLTTPLSDRATITGARAATPYGEHVAGELAMGLADEERVVVSGGAYGIEGAAHKSVLAASGQTIAVLTGGLDRPYPAGHSELLSRIGDVGLLVSELPPGAAPTRYRFLARNRLLAALSGLTVIPEASPRSGSMTTVIAARELGRGVGAVPGPVTSVASAGPNELIKQGFAVLVTQPSDVIALLDSNAPNRVVARSELGRDLGYRWPSSGAPGPSL
jgi:DNA processing protein